MLWMSQRQTFLYLLKVQQNTYTMLSEGDFMQMLEETLEKSDP